MSVVYYSIAKYVNDIVRNEQVNFGLAYFSPDEKKIGFLASTNNSRILAFDDELDLEELKYLRSSLNFDFSLEGLEYDNKEYIEELLSSNSNKILKMKTMNYINQIQFTEHEQIELGERSLNEILEDLKDIYLYYDRPKSVREMDKDRIRILTKQIIRNQISKDAYSIDKLKKNSWSNKPYDFIVNVNSEQKYLKSLTFDYKQDSHLINQIKLFVFDLKNYLDQNQIDINNFIVVINNTSFEKQIEQEAKQFLSDQGVEILTLQECNDFLSHSQII
ncbi:DUF3037 domain-containing protein [Kurthia sp. YJT4]|uniref:DUF3037 domain-containing protein n=1 Tax=Kurthia sp. YJT4 TaxID=3049086 RepID=UPI00254BE292|nr:DUF3037 domain-containing protein [Kurthia sp. YJT4]WIL39707.1 DUF3037 domain-containing protein [Kurthia sp. YJT4]